MKKRKDSQLVKNQRENNKVKTALVLSGGGAKGAYQVGIIEELLKADIYPDLITASSIGAYNGALVAEFIREVNSAEEITKKLKKVWEQSSDLLEIDWKGIAKNIYSPHKITSIFKNNNIKKILNEYIKVERSFSDYNKCQLSVTATNLNQKRSEIFDYNSKIGVKKAVLASMSYPVGLPAVQWDGDNYIDGGVLDNTPLKEAILWGAERIFVVFLTPISVIKDNIGKILTQRLFNCEKEGYSAIKVLDELIELASGTLMYGDLKRAEKINELINLLYNYEDKLDPNFLNDIKDVFNLNKNSGKRIIDIIKIAPEYILDPPGTMGFYRRKDIEKLILKGKEDMKKTLKKYEL
mgnify:CR=1 FL=1